MFYKESQMTEGFGGGGTAHMDYAGVLDERQLLDQGVLRKKFDPQEIVWLKAFYDKEPWIKEELQAISQGQDNSEYFRGKIWSAAEKQAGQLLETEPAFQVGDWSYLKKNWRGTVYKNILMQMCVWQAQGNEDLVASEIRNLARFTWLSTEDPGQTFEQALALASDGFSTDERSKSSETTQRQAQIKTLKLKAIELRKKGKRLLAPADYLTQAKTRGAVNSAKAEIHTESWEELVELSESALFERNAVRYLAIAQKLAETGNEDKLFNHTRYIEDVSAKDSADGKEHRAGEFFSFSRTGIENFRKQILVHKLGLGEQASMRNLADITNIAEYNNHHGIMRVYGSRNGKYRFKSYMEWHEEVAAEKGKMPTNTILGQSTNFSGYEGIPALDFELTGTVVPILEENELEYYVKNWNAIKFLHGRGQLNPSQAKAAAMPQNAARIIAAASQLESKTVELKDGNGQPILDKETGKPKVVDQKEEALRVLKDLFIAFGQQQILPEEWGANQKALQELLNQDKIEGRYRESIKQAQSNALVDERYKIFSI
jgi:hypothetical protein